MTNKLKYFVANWKMFGNLASLKSANKINYYISSKKNCDLIVKSFYVYPIH